ncbi:MAG: nickel-dependent lactate racemase [Deltaproteobacteria bacterium]|nr:nickel-dependent lactate racemase [Deltaproteobacteria bacterium]
MNSTDLNGPQGPQRRIVLKYGRDTAMLPDGIFRSVYFAAARPPLLPPSEEKLVSQRISRPIGSLPLRQILSAGDSVAIAISDVTRYSGTEKFLAPLLLETDAACVPRNRVTLFVARGTHRAMTGTELQDAIGPELASGVRVEQSDPDGDSVLVGTTSRGTKVHLYRPVAESDRVILTGTISFHYFAGFGGGRKALVPGCASRQTAEATHFRIFRTEGPGKHPLARAGVLAGNPVHEDILEAVSMAPPCFLVNTLLTPDKKLFDVVAGHWQKAHEEGCARYSKTYRVRIPMRYPLVIASAGGFPKDINFIQSHKAMDYAFAAIEPGGVMILLAECPDGFGSPQFFPWFRFDDPDEMETELRANYQIYGQTAHAAFVKAKACRIILVSSLRPEDVERMGMTHAASLDAALEQARGLLGYLPATLVIPDAGCVLPDVPG